MGNHVSANECDSRKNYLH